MDYTDVLGFQPINGNSTKQLFLRKLLKIPQNVSNELVPKSIRKCFKVRKSVVFKLAELHGNSQMERCEKCGKEYLRDFKCRIRGRKDHRTGRFCTIKDCKGRLSMLSSKR